MQIKRDFIGMFDVSKGVVMVLILLIHQVSFCHDVLPSIAADVLHFLFQYGAAVIALLFLMAGYSSRREANLSEYVKRQAKELLVPYFILMLICTFGRGLLFFCIGEFRIQEMTVVALAFLYGAETSFEFLGHVWIGSVGAFWFLGALFGASILRQLLWRIQNEKLQAICLWGLVLVGVSFPNTSQLQLPWFLVQSCTALGFLEAGRLLKKHKLLYRDYHPLAYLAATALWVLLHVYSQANIGSNKWSFWMLDYLGTILVSAVLLRLYLRSGLAVLPGTGLLAYIGRYSLYFLFLHGIEYIIIPWDVSLRPSLESLRLPGWIVLIVIAVLRLLFALGGCAVLTQIKNHWRKRQPNTKEKKGRAQHES